MGVGGREGGRKGRGGEGEEISIHGLKLVAPPMPMWTISLNQRYDYFSNPNNNREVIDRYNALASWPSRIDS